MIALVSLFFITMIPIDCKIFLVFVLDGTFSRCTVGNHLILYNGILCEILYCTNYVRGYKLA